MAFPWIMLAQIAMQAKQKREAEAAARRQAIASSHERQAQRYGFPTDTLEADRFNKQFKDQEEAAKAQWRASMLSALVSMGGSKGAESDGGGPLDRVAEDKADAYARDAYYGRMFDALGGRYR